MEKNYVTKKEGSLLSFPYDWHQTFHHPFDMTKSMNEAVVIKMYMARPASDRHAILEMLINLHNFTFATEAQLQTLMANKGIDTANLEDLLNQCLQNRFINKFSICAYEMDSIPDDAFEVYCLDHGARAILSHMYRDDIAVTWRSTNSIRSAEQISKYLVTNEFYIALANAKRDKLRYFNPTADFSIGKRDIRLSASFCILKGSTPCNFLLEVVRYSDIPVYWEKKTGEQLLPFLEKTWNRYFDTEPICIFVAEDLDQGLELSKIFTRRTTMDKFRVTTDAEIEKGFEKAKFYKYDPTKDKLTAVTSTIFKPAVEAASD